VDTTLSEALYDALMFSHHSLSLAR
jgi:hypothetical protein